MGLQPNQTGPLNIAGGLEGEGNDLGFHHTSLGTETHHRQTDGQTDRQEPGRRTHLTLGSLPFAPTRKESQNTGYADNPALPPATHSSVCGDLPPATGGPQGDFLWLFLHFGSLLANSTASSFPQPPAQSLGGVFYHLLGPSLSCSLLSGLLAPGLLGEAASRAPSSYRGPLLGPVCPAAGLTQLLRSL